tara:strand:+ start:3380 stop:4330 length:951 start_codon:yes stop_codon:yes gene_type:complete
MSQNNQPWVEKYRPNKFKDIVLDKINSKILTNIIEKQYFPNLLLYGPPGTGKTTTIINLIKRYHEKLNIKSKGLIIHLNASDDRGVDIVRNQINQFVNTKTLFNNGIKFIILDEVDYMTKNAQSALRYLIQQYSSNIRFCLICNYISRIDTALQNEFVRLKFCNLPKPKIISFLKNIIMKENIQISEDKLNHIQNIFNSDMRSMINYIQSNSSILIKNNYEVISENVWNELIENYFKKNKSNIKIKNYIKNSCIKYNIRIKNFIIKFISYLLHNKDYSLNNNWLNTCQLIIHYIDDNINKNMLAYFISSFLELYKS